MNQGLGQSMVEIDMASNGTFDPVSSYARLSERVEGQGKDLVDIRSNMNTGFHQVNQNINALANETRSSINAITNELRGNSRTQWPVIWSAIGVSFVVLAAVGGLAYQPVVSNQGRLETALVRLADVAVTRQEIDSRSARGLEDRTRMEAAIANLAENAVGRNELEQMVTEYRDYKARIENEIRDKVPRNEWSERNLNRDHEIASLQRQIDQQRTDFQTFANSLGNGRDFIVDLKTEVARLRDQLAEIRARQYQRMGSPPG